MLVIMGAFCCQDVPGVMCISQWALPYKMLQCVLWINLSVHVEDNVYMFVITHAFSTHRDFLKSMVLILLLISTHPCYACVHTHTENSRKLPWCIFIQSSAVEPPFLHPFKDTAGFNFACCSFLPVCVKMGQYFFLSQLVLGVLVPESVCQTWSSQLGEHRRGGQRFPHFPAKSLSCPTVPFVHSTHSSTNANTKTQTYKKFPKHTWASQVHWCDLFAYVCTLTVCLFCCKCTIAESLHTQVCNRQHKHPLD